LKFNGKAATWKEFQSFVAFCCYSKMVESGEDYNIGQQHNELSRLYHGMMDDAGKRTSDDVSYAEQSVMGINQFKGLFDKVDIAVNEASNSSNTNTFNNVLKHTLHREGPYKCIVANANSVSGELSLKLISSSTYKGDKEIEGRTILRRAQDVMANGRKALAVAMHHDSPYRHGTLPSGHCLADYHDYILEHMEKLLKGQPPISVEDTGRDRHTDNEDIPTQTMLPNATAVDVSSTGTKHPRTNRDFIFRGWMVFALLGFIVPDGMEQYKTQLFNLQNPPGGTDNGRKKARKEQAKKASGVRNDNAEGDRGVSTQQQIQLASLANQS